MLSSDRNETSTGSRRRVTGKRTKLALSRVYYPRREIWHGQRREREESKIMKKKEDCTFFFFFFFFCCCYLRCCVSHSVSFTRGSNFNRKTYLQVKYIAITIDGSARHHHDRRRLFSLVGSISYPVYQQSFLSGQYFDSKTIKKKSEWLLEREREKERRDIFGLHKHRDEQREREREREIERIRQ